jgi:hypothetical protein
MLIDYCQSSNTKYGSHLLINTRLLYPYLIQNLNMQKYIQIAISLTDLFFFFIKDLLVSPLYDFWGLGEMFEGDPADTSAGKISASVDGGGEGLVFVDPGARTPIGASGIYICVTSFSLVYLSSPIST